MKKRNLQLTLLLSIVTLCLVSSNINGMQRQRATAIAHADGTFEIITTENHVRGNALHAVRQAQQATPITRPQRILAGKTASECYELLSRAVTLFQRGDSTSIELLASDPQALEVALHAKKYEWIHLLLTYGADKRIIIGQHGIKAVENALDLNDPKRYEQFCCYLVDQGLDLRAPILDNRKRRTTLAHKAAMNGFLDLIATYAAKHIHKVNLNDIKDAQANTLLHAAWLDEMIIHRGLSPIFMTELLIHTGCTITNKNRANCTVPEAIARTLDNMVDEELFCDSSTELVRTYTQKLCDPTRTTPDFNIVKKRAEVARKERNNLCEKIVQQNVTTPLTTGSSPYGLSSIPTSPTDDERTSSATRFRDMVQDVTRSEDQTPYLTSDRSPLDDYEAEQAADREDELNTMMVELGLETGGLREPTPTPDNRRFPSIARPEQRVQRPRQGLPPRAPSRNTTETRLPRMIQEDRRIEQ